MFFLGLDIGSGYSKAVVCDDTLLVAYAVMPSGGNYRDTALRVADEALGKAGLSQGAIAATVATGYGATACDFVQDSASDISCNGVGIHHLFPSVRTVIDIGAQYSRASRIDGTGKTTYFVLNEKCAGGSGKFLQVVARILHVPVEEIGPLSLTSTSPVNFTTGCAVFAESEAVSRIAEGARPGDIVAGIHRAMASKIVTLVTRVGLERDCAITGGGAKDQGLVRTLAESLDAAVFVPEEPQITAALGAALIASEKFRK